MISGTNKAGANLEVAVQSFTENTSITMAVICPSFGVPAFSMQQGVHHFVPATFAGDRIRRHLRKGRKLQQRVRATMDAGVAPSLPASFYAKQMERYAAKESLKLAIKDSGILDTSPIRNITEMERIDISERVIKLERLNPTPRPTTSPYLEGIWRFQWFGINNPGLLVASLLLESLPTSAASINNLDLLIMDGNAKATATVQLLNLIECKFTLTTKLTVEGPMRLKEESIDGVFQLSPVRENVIPDQFKNTYEQILNGLQQLPDPVKETLSSGLRLSINGTLQRMLLVSYLDEDVLIFRDTTGAANVLSKVDGNSVVVVESMIEYES